ncbi:MAG: hypothetical protein GC164_14160 [Phycisphaera sp.]|nr:hypothetical protein [Phycisphaera sp.]
MTNIENIVSQFNASDDQSVVQAISNEDSLAFLRENVPLLDCADRQLLTTYYFRWWTYRKHIQKTPEGFAITEFLPKVGWAGQYNMISCALGHHIYEGRWLRDPRYMDDEIRFWLTPGREGLHRYSNWLADAMWARRCVSGDSALNTQLLDATVADFERWKMDRLGAGGLYWQSANADGMEVAIGGDGYRPTINSYMYGAAIAIAAMARDARRPDLADRFEANAAQIKRLVQKELWNPQVKFFTMRRRDRNKPDEISPLIATREQLGYIPWYFDLPDDGYEAAWSQVTAPEGFSAPFGLTTAEQRDREFAIRYSGHDCQWNGPVWPYATSQTLTAMANLLNDYDQKVVSKRDYFDTLLCYARSQRLVRDDGRIVPWIDEDQNPYTGDWIARKLHHLRDPDNERGKDYNHSTFCDLVITGLIGLRPRADDKIVVNPLLPDRAWDWFMLDNVTYHGYRLTIVWDRDGNHYQHGKGLAIFADGKPIAHAESLTRLTATLPPKT